MVATEVPDTRASLLAGLANGDHGYREEFLRGYLPLLYTWARHQGCGDQDAEDIAHDIALRIASDLPARVRDKECPLHRYLLAMVRNAVINVLRKNKRVRQILEPYQRERERREQLGPAPITLNESDDASQTPDGDADRCPHDDQTEIDFRWTIDELEQLAVLADAKFRVSRMCSEKEWRAYRMRCEKVLSPEHVADELKIAVGTVHNAVLKVKNLIAIEIRNWYG